MDRSAQERIEDRSARVAVLGQGYVGLVVSMEASAAGFEVVGYEVERERVSALRRGVSYVEDVPDDVLRAALDRGYRATDEAGELAGFDVAVISVPTPLTDGSPNLGAVESAAGTVGDVLRPGCLVVLESTTYPGTTEELVGPILEMRSGLRVGRDFMLGYSPERIDPGNSVHTLRSTPKVVAGVDQLSQEAIAAFYSAFVDRVVPVSAPSVAELTKLLENTFRHVNIALVNELARFAHDLGVDIWEAIDAAATKPFGFMPFRPGPGVGGHCLPVDPTYLSWRVKRQLKETFHFVELANEVNAQMPSYIVRRVQGVLNADKLAVNGTSVLVLGAAYKPNTSDARESPATPIVGQLVSMGANVTVVDPHVPDSPLGPEVTFLRELTPEPVRNADVVVLLADHDGFDYPMVAREATRIFDARNRFADLDAANVERL